MSRVATDHGVFRSEPRSTIARPRPATALAARQRQAHDIRGCSPGSSSLRFAPKRARVNPPGQAGLRHFPTPPEVSRPSGDVTAGVRSYPGFPPPAPSALGLSQAFDGLLLQQLTCLVSYRYHLWDSKNTNHPLLPDPHRCTHPEMGRCANRARTRRHTEVHQHRSTRREASCETAPDRLDQDRRNPTKLAAWTANSEELTNHTNLDDGTPPAFTSNNQPDTNTVVCHSPLKP